MKAIVIFLLMMIWSSPFLVANEKHKVTKVAVVDVLKLIDEYEKSGELEKKLEDQFAKEEKMIKDLESEIKSLRAELSYAGENKKEELQKKILEKEISYKVKRENIKKDLGRKHIKFTEDVYLDIVKAIRQYGEKEKVDMIFKKSDYERVKEPQMKMKLLNEMEILYNKNSMDITDEVLSLLNTKYRQLQKK